MNCSERCFHLGPPQSSERVMYFMDGIHKQRDWLRFVNALGYIVHLMEAHANGYYDNNCVSK
jgi:hypothetical protein